MTNAEVQRYLLFCLPESTPILHHYDVFIDSLVSSLMGPRIMAEITSKSKNVGLWPSLTCCNLFGVNFVGLAKRRNRNKNF